MKLTFQFLERNFERVTSSLILVVIAISLFAQVISRYLFGAPLTWPEEMVSLFFPWFVYLGACYGVREGAHIRLTHHIVLFPMKWQIAIRVVADLIWMGYSLVMFYQGIVFVRSMFAFPFRGQVFRISLAYVYMILPFAFGIMFVRVAWSIFRVVMKREDPYSIRQQKQLLD